MPPIRLNRRRFLGCSAAAGWALSQGHGLEAGGDPAPVRLGLIGLGNRGTSLLRTALELPGVEVLAVCDAEPRHRLRARGIAEKAKGARPDALEEIDALLARPEIDAVLVALPCDLHAACYLDTIAAKKDLYGEKPMCLTVEECNKVVEAAGKSDRIVQIGFQRRTDRRWKPTWTTRSTARAASAIRRSHSPRVGARGFSA